MTIGGDDLFDDDGYLDENLNEDYVTTDSELVEDDELGSNLANAIDATPKTTEERKRISKPKRELKQQETLKRQIPEKLKAKGIKAMVLVMDNGKKVFYA
jgi:hypothetical protein